ncbi:tol-pal system protein YbgF [Rhodovulum sp. YNF3179]|uniref:tol-pal system protein YbgF n=1 Tax=Rhodovulum sp. YNF3179 TaxID=3425127 RepID=UPI003D3259BD
MTRPALLLATCLALVLPATGAWAQARGETLADIRQDLSVLYVEIQRLKRELSTTGGPSVATGGSSLLDRVDSLETELRRLTARAEELDHRIRSVVEDGTNRVGDLEFRLCELEEDCDIAELGDTPSLGGVPDDEIRIDPEPAPGGGNGAAPELAMGEQADFDAARAAYDAGDFQAAAEQFQDFTTNYPGGALSGAAHFWRGEALAALEDWSGAARAYLDSFSGDPDGDKAPVALLRLGISLDRIGQREEACLTLGEVPARYPGSAAAEEARAQMRAFGCQ